MRWFALVVVAACVHSGTTLPSWPGMGKVHFAIDTRSPQAQQHFDAGLAAAYGFNYDEAMYEFNAALHADPDCAMCLWGAAYVAGPNINAVTKQFPGAYENAVLANQRAKRPLEKAVTKALIARLSPQLTYPPDQRSPMDDAYLAAMREAGALAPTDPDIQTLLAEAVFMATPVGEPAWAKDHTTKYPHVTEAIAILEQILARHPDHIGAIHFYIHAVDNSPFMEKAMPFAQRLATLTPESGHLLHMPSHLTLKLGRYAEAEAENRAAIAADARFVARLGHGTQYEMFTMHPRQYLLYVLTIEGASKEAKQLAKQLGDEVEKPGMGPPGAQGATFVVGTAIRFGDWDAMAALPAPIGPIPTIVFSFGRGLALVAQGKLDEATAEVEKIRKGPDVPEPGQPPAPAPATPAGPAPAAGDAHAEHAKHAEHAEHAKSADEHPAEDKHDEPMPMPGMGPSPAELKKQHDMMVGVSGLFAAELEGAIAEARKDHAKAIDILRRAVELEDGLPDLGELGRPAFTARQRLGAVLLAAGQPAEAEVVYRKDLENFPENGWALFGLAQALDAQHKPEAAAVHARFEAAWKHADIKLTSSVF